MSDHAIATLIEVALAVSPIVVVPLLCWWDPAHLVAKAREEAATKD